MLGWLILINELKFWSQFRFLIWIGNPTPPCWWSDHRTRHIRFSPSSFGTATIDSDFADNTTEWFYFSEGRWEVGHKSGWSSRATANIRRSSYWDGWGTKSWRTRTDFRGFVGRFRVFPSSFSAVSVTVNDSSPTQQDDVKVDEVHPVLMQEESPMVMPTAEH